jgi:hypothetical protein
MTHPTVCAHGFLVALLPAFALAQDSGFAPPTAVTFFDDFDSSAPLPANWQIDAGNWVASNGTYNSQSVAPFARTTITEYVNPLRPDHPPNTILAPYTLRARVRIPSGGVRQLAGVVFDYEDEANFREAVFSSSGTWQLRKVSFGVSTTFAAGGYSGGGPNVWFDVEVGHGFHIVTVKINGNLLASVNMGAPPTFGARVGLTTHETVARFDKVSIAVLCCQSPVTNGIPQPLRNHFNGVFPPGFLGGNWTKFSGEWSVVSNVLTTPSVQATSALWHEYFYIDIAPGSTLAYTLRARMLNPYGGSGNLVGMFFNDSPAGRGEVVFSPTGVARIRLIRNGSIETIATSPYLGQRNVWFDVRMDVDSNRITVTVDGNTIFEDVFTADIFEGRGGLVTHWAPGKFDDVWYENRSIFHPLSQTFESAPPPNWTVSGTWNTSGSTLNNTSAGVSDIVTTNCGCWESDFSYRARLLNEYGASGNLVGLVYNYQRVPARQNDSRPYLGLYNGDYYEVVFSPTGQAFMNKVLNGVRYRVATGAHNVPRNVWFNVEVLRQTELFGEAAQSLQTTVRVNGVTIFDRVPQGELPYGDVGVVAHWARSRFDNLSVTDAPRR